MKKRISLLLACTLVVGMLAGCGSTQKTPAEEKNTLTEETGESKVKQTVDNTNTSDNAADGYELVVWVGADMVLETQGECWQEYIDTFLANNENVKSITLVPMGDAERLAAIMAGVGLPDVYFGSARDAQKFYQATDLLDLSDIYADEEWSGGFYDDAVDHVTYEGKQWAIPLISYVSHMYRNLDILEKAGCEYKEEYATMDEFIADLQAIQKAGYTGTNSWVQSGWYGIGTIAAAEGDSITVGVKDNKTTILPEQLVRSFETLLEIEKYANNMPYGEDATVESFCAGEIGFLLDGPWTEYAIQASGVNYDVVLLPGYDENYTGGVKGWDYYYGVDSGDADRNEVVKELLKYLGSYEAEKLWTIKVGRPTLREDVMSDSQVLQTMMCKMQAKGNEGGMIQMDFFHDNVFWMSAFADVVTLVGNGTYTPEEGAKAMVDAVNALYAEQG